MEVSGRIWINRNQASYLGRGRIELLEQVKLHGSILQAAKAMKMSYKAAWDSINTMNNLSPINLVERVSGGRGGGGTRVTEAGENAIRTFRECERVQERLFEVIGDSLEDWNLAIEKMRRISMKTSARNHFSGVVRRVKRGAVNAEVLLDIGGAEICAVITNASVGELGLDVGTNASAIIKANWVMLATGNLEKISARNCLKGVVSEITKGEVSAEVKLKVGDRNLVSVVTNDAVENLELEVGKEAWAIIKASNVLIGI